MYINIVCLPLEAFTKSDFLISFHLYCIVLLLQGPQRRRSSVGVAMDSLKIAANKVKKSPRVLKGKIDSALNKDSEYKRFKL